MADDKIKSAAEESEPVTEPIVSVIRRLASLSTVEYESVRKAEAKRLGWRPSALDREVEAAREKDEGGECEPPVDVPALAESAKDIIATNNVLERFAVDWRQAMAGEEDNAKVLYLVATSRLFGKTMHAAVKGPSSAGKSELRKRVLAFLPPESVISFSALSEKALLYFQDDFCHKILSMGEASGTDQQEFQDYLLRELMSEGRLSYPTVQKVDGQLESIIIEKNGPVAFMVTTTKRKLHPENETRMLSLEIDDSEGQTKAVLAKVAEVEGLNTEAVKLNYQPWHDFQRWLAAGEREVVLPFADVLAALVPPRSVRLRRDLGQVLRAIKAHALLHREHRARDERGQIVATIAEDYAAIRELMHDLLQETSEVKVKKAVLETIEAVKKATAGRHPEDGATAQEVGHLLKLDKSSALRRLRAAEGDGFVVNLETRHGQRGRYRTTSQSLETIEMMPTPEALEIASARKFHTTAQPCNREDISKGKQDSCQLQAPLQPAAQPLADGAGGKAGCNGHATAETRSIPPKNGGGLHGCTVATDLEAENCCLQCGNPIEPEQAPILIRGRGEIHDFCGPAFYDENPVEQTSTRRI